MAFKTIWKILNTERQFIDGELENVIKAIEYQVLLTEGPDEQALADQVNFVSIDSPSSSFISYENVTEANCIAWVQEVLGDKKIAEIQFELETAHANRDNSVITGSGLPWE